MASNTEPKADSERQLHVIEGGLDERLRELERLLYGEAADEVSRWTRIIYIASRIDRRGALRVIAGSACGDPDVLVGSKPSETPRSKRFGEAAS